MRTAKQIMADMRAQHAREDDDQLLHDAMPPVEVHARPAVPSEIPRGAKPFIKLSEQTKITYARGPIRKRDGWKMTDSVMVKGIKGDRAFSAVWLDGRLDCAFAHGVGRVNAKQLRYYLGHEEDIPWLDGFEAAARINREGGHR